MNAIASTTMKAKRKRNKGSLVLCLCFLLHHSSEQGLWFFILTYVISYFEYKPCLLLDHQCSNTSWGHLSSTPTQHNVQSYAIIKYIRWIIKLIKGMLNVWNLPSKSWILQNLIKCLFTCLTFMFHWQVINCKSKPVLLSVTSLVHSELIRKVHMNLIASVESRHFTTGITMCRMR